MYSITFLSHFITAFILHRTEGESHQDHRGNSKAQGQPQGTRTQGTEEIPECLHSLTLFAPYFHCHILILPYITISRTSLVTYLQVCEMEGEHQQWTARHVAAVDAAQSQQLAKTESERKEFEQARTALCCPIRTTSFSPCNL